MSKIKRLFLDLETSPNVVYTWRIGYNLTIPHENIIHERKIICAGYKWQDEKEVKSLQWKNGDDKHLLTELVKVMSEADEIVAHNGDKFDIRWVRARCLYHGIELPAQIKTIDTLKLAKDGFYFNSNKLDYIAGFLGLGSKIKTEFKLWIDVVNQNKRALAEMVRYCKHDVAILEKVYNKLESYIPLKTHIGVLVGGLKSDCPQCGSGSVQNRGTRVSAAGRITVRLWCGKCPRWFSVPVTTLNSDNKRRSKKI